MLDNVTASDNHSVDLVHGGSGIELYTNGAITANNIYSTGNLKYGMKLDNCNYSGSACLSTTTGAVSVSNSEFSGNKQNSGLDIVSRGLVTLKKVVSNENSNSSAFGVKIDNTYGTSGVTITGTIAGDNQFSQNGTHGVQIDSTGNISLNYVSSEENTGDGAWLVNKLGKGTVSVSNSRFYKNISSGLNIESKNNVTILNVISNENLGGSGVKIDNRIFTTGLGYGSVAVTYLTAMKNSDWGLDVLSNGTISGTGITANENPLGGARLNNQEATYPKNVSISKSVFNLNKFGGELGPGLVVLSKGAITLSGVGAKNNGLGGVILVNPSAFGAVVINNSLNPVLYTISGNGEDGVVIITKGAVTLTGVYADENRSGALIDNYFVGGTAPVTISASHFNQNNVGSGLDVNSTGKIMLTKVSANGNNSFGARLINQNATYSSQVSVVNDVLKIGTELNGFCGNGSDGLNISAKGVVTLTNVESNGNSGEGTHIDNVNATNADVKITNSYFDNNTVGGYGLFITSQGNIILNAGSVSGNQQNGTLLDNQLSGVTIIKNITISKFKMNANLSGFGLEAKSNGVFSVQSVQGDGNGTFGIRLNNQTSSIGAGITVKNSHTNGNNNGTGLELLSNGAILIDGITSNENKLGFGYGIVAKSTPLVAGSKSVTINRTTINGNDQDGLNVNAVGMITLNGVSANGNTHSGAVLDNSSMSITSGVTILSSLGVNNFNNNIGDFGVSILTRGQVSLSLVTANNNLDGTGVSVDNCVGGAPGCGQANVSFSKVTTRLNGEDGVLINTNALTVTMNGLVSLSNGGSGIKITSNNSQAKISLLNSLFMGNIGHGIEIKRPGLLTPFLTGSSYFGNGTAPNLFVHN